MSEAGNAVSTKQGGCKIRHGAKTLFSGTGIIFSGFHASSRPGANERATQAVHEVRSGMSEAGNAVSTKQGSCKIRHGAKTIFSGFHASSRPGANERATQTVHEVRQEVSEAGNAVSTKQGSRK
jgi:hypothetical protein